MPSDICSQTATASHFPAVCRPFPAPPPKLGYFDMNGDVEVFTQRVTEYLSVTLHNASGTLAVTVPLHWRLNAVGVHFAGRYAEEAILLRLLGQLESAQPWFKKGSGAVSTPSDAQRDFAALGQLGLIARPSVFDRLRLGRGEALAEPLGAACSIKRGLGVALEPRHHLARDQFVTP